MERGYIRLWRKTMDWEWYTDTITKAAFFHCLMKANHADKTWKGIPIKRGQFITSLQRFANETGLSIQQVRSSLKKLEKTHEITSQATNRHTVITLLKYDSYAPVIMNSNTPENILPNKQITNKEQTDNKQITTTNNYKELSITKEKREGAAPTAPILQSMIETIKEKHGVDKSIDSQWLRYAQNDVTKMRSMGYDDDRIQTVIDWYRDNEFFCVLDTFQKLDKYFLEIENKMKGDHADVDFSFFEEPVI